jgi:predicted aspartyl protease
MKLRTIPALLAAALAILAAPLAAKTVVPMDLGNIFPVAEVVINGKPFSFIVDTGASDSVIDVAAVEEAGLVVEGAMTGTAQGGEIAGSRLKQASLSIGGVAIPHVRLFALPLAGLSAGAGRRIDGILGYDLFRGHVVRFDYPGRRLVIDDDGALPGAESIPIEIAGQTPFVRMQVRQQGRGVAARMLIDTGAAGAVTLNALFSAAHPGIVPGRTVAISSGALLPGRYLARVGRLESVRIGPFTLAAPVANFSSAAETDDATPEDSGLIGSDLLRRFVLVVDYPRKRILLAPAGAALREPFRFDSVGASLVAVAPDFRVKKVRTIVAGSPAQAAGLARDDEIVEIDGRAAANLTLIRIREMFREGVGSHRLRIRRGGELRTVEVRPRPLV